MLEQSITQYQFIKGLEKKSNIAHIEPMTPFGTLWKNQKTIMSFYGFKGSQMGTLAQYGLEQD